MLRAAAGDRQGAYRELVMSGLDASETETIRLTLQRQHALGNDRFRAAIERQPGRFAGPGRIGRPAKAGTQARRPDPENSAL